jgi:putative FmdB family regulatory protein
MFDVHLLNKGDRPMPIYEYQCQKCREVTEAMQKFSDSPLTQCPSCRGELKKMISHSSFHLKGSGWYVTDYSRKGSSAPESKKTEPADKPAAAADSGTAAASAPAPKADPA